MMVIKNYVAPSEVHGVGLFAGENIQKDQIIYVFNPVVDVVMKADRIESLGTEFARFMRMYAYCELNTREVIISIDNSKFMNHCEFPNTMWTFIYGWAAKNIREGEELTCDYYSFWHEPPL